MSLIAIVKMIISISLFMICTRFYDKYRYFKKYGVKVKGKIIKEYKKVSSEGYNYFFLIEYLHNEKLIQKEVGVIGPFTYVKSENINLYVDFNDETNIFIDEKFNYVVYYGLALISVILLINVIVAIY